MLRRDSQPNLSVSATSLFKLPSELTKLYDEQEKLASYIAARRLIGAARSKINFNTSNGYHLFLHLQSVLFIKIDKILRTMNSEIYEAYLDENIKEIVHLFGLPEVKESVEAELFRLIDAGVCAREGFKSAMQRALTEKLADEMKDEDIRDNQDMTSMAETFYSFIKCGAILSFRKMMSNMDDETRHQIIAKFGQRMLHHAVWSGQIEFVKELLQYDININKHYQAPAVKGDPRNTERYDSVLAYALLQTFFDLMDEDATHEKFYSDLKEFFATSHVVTDYQMPNYKQPDLNKVACEDAAIIDLLLSHGADADLRGYTKREKGWNSDAPQSREKIKHEEPSLRELCTALKKDLVEAKQDPDFSLNMSMREVMIPILDKVIHAPVLRPSVTPFL